MASEVRISWLKTFETKTSGAHIFEVSIFVIKIFVEVQTSEILEYLFLIAKRETAEKQCWITLENQ